MDEKREHLLKALRPSDHTKCLLGSQLWVFKPTAHIFNVVLCGKILVLWSVRNLYRGIWRYALDMVLQEEPAMTKSKPPDRDRLILI